MNNQFHRILNRMVLFTALIVAGIIVFREEFLRLALNNIWLNGIIIGTGIFGVVISFADVFKLIPEHRWLRKFFYGKPGEPIPALPPFTMRPVAQMLTSVRLQAKPYISSQTLNSFLEIIRGRFEDSREQQRYITNILVFMGLLGTFWGLILTIGNFGDIFGAIDTAASPTEVVATMRHSLLAPLYGMGTAFSSSFLGLSASLVVGFLSLQTSLAQNAIYRELEENLSGQTKLFGYLNNPQTGEEAALPYAQLAAKEFSETNRILSRSLEKGLKQMQTRDKQLSTAIKKLDTTIKSLKSKVPAKAIKHKGGRNAKK